MRRFARTGYGFLKNLNEQSAKSRSLRISSVHASTCLQSEWDTTKETTFNHLSLKQQQRAYAPKQCTNRKDCWNCQKEHRSREILVQCKHCGFLQDVETDVNYFELLDLPQTFNLENHMLTKHFRKLQTLVHPDKFSNKSSREQSNSADWSSLVNKAYKTLLTPLERGEYLLLLNGLQMPQDNSVLDKEFLMEMMERNEKVENAKTNNELNAINSNLEEELRVKVQYLAKSFLENNLDMSKLLLIEMKYLISIQKAIKKKLQTMISS